MSVERRAESLQEAIRGVGIRSRPFKNENYRLKYELSALPLKRNLDSEIFHYR